MAACSVAVSSRLQEIGAADADRNNVVKQSAGTCEARFAGCSRIVRLSSRNLRHGSWSREKVERRYYSVRAQAGEGSLQPREGSLQQSENWGEGVSLGTALLPPDADLGKLEALLFQVSSSLHILIGVTLCGAESE